MKEHPILFSAPMVRALLAGHKTQTRRAVKPQPTGFDYGCCKPFDDRLRSINNPYGQPGDRLWVRETWRGVVPINPPGAAPEYGVARYVPDQEHCRRVEYAATQDRDEEPWRPSIHMPRWASRITLEIVSVRVERLQDISEADVLAEGCNGGHGSIPGYSYNASPAEHFVHVWASAYGNDSWIDNPWVWVVEFRRLP